MVRGLTLSGQVDVVAETEDGPATLTAIREHLPDVALVDFRMPSLEGPQIARAVVRDALRTRVLLLSAFTDGPLVYNALQEGAAGYLSKEAKRSEIVAGVLACARGEHVLAADLAAGMVGEIQQRGRPSGPRLSEREAQVLALIAQGKSIPAIAGELYLGVTTVKTHAQHLYEKLGVSDRAAAVAEAMRRGLLE